MGGKESMYLYSIDKINLILLSRREQMLTEYRVENADF